MNLDNWWLSINPKVLHFRDLEVGDCFYYTALNEDGTPRTLYKNFAEIKVGSYVIAYETEPANEVIGLCQVVEELKDNKVMFQKVEGLTDTVSRYAIECHIELANLEVFRYTQGTLFKLAPREYEVIYSMMRELNPKKQYRYYEDYSKEKFLEEVYFDEKDYDELRSLILRRKNVILEGAPGVGKTYIAKKMVFSILGQKDEEKILPVQFHELYSTDEFMEGYRADDIGIYKYKRGCFKRICNKARNDPEHKYFVIIDEINRGNIAKIFGEAFSLIELDKRGKENYIELACSRERFYVPENIYIIGTMNTYDSDLAITDFALRRRFSFYTIKPIFENKRFKQFYMQNPALEKLVRNVIKVNENLDDSVKIGHAYFCKPMDAEDINMTVKYNLIPYLKQCQKNDGVSAQQLIQILESECPMETEESRHFKRN